jgi:hypothetical protein
MDVPPELKEAIPGIGGSITALLFFRDSSWPRVIGLCIAGAFVAKIVGPYMAGVMRATPEVAGYITGLFGMSIVAKIFDMILSFDTKQAVGDLWSAIVKRVRG